jgi:DNA-binding transcriptional LysR family regulator
LSAALVLSPSPLAP